MQQTGPILHTDPFRRSETRTDRMPTGHQGTCFNLLYPTRHGRVCTLTKLERSFSSMCADELRVAILCCGRAQARAARADARINSASELRQERPEEGRL